MENIGHFFHAWLVFIAPLMYLGYKPEFKKQILFTGFYGLGVMFFRSIYNFLLVPYGTHMILLIILNTVLIATIIKKINLIKALSISLITFTVLLVNDLIIFIPIIKYFNITVSNIGRNNIISYTIFSLLSNFSLIVMYIIGALKHREKQTY